MMGKLKVLPASLANVIAAGEVVQRPASVVKELMENAVDAGATDVRVVVTDSGRTLIQVIDNGCGMSAADAVLCFERHATSKISTVGDLQSIMTFGFRGEALPSIASVAEVALKTRRQGDETGTEVRFTEGGTLRSQACQTPVGSNFTVRNLFYNTPARRRFLKSDNVELKHIVEEFTRVAVTRPEVAFSLSSNGREIYGLKQAKSLKFRILDLIGANMVSDLVDIQSETAIMGISGFVGRPQSSHKSSFNQFFFVNGRYFRSPLLHKAVLQAYENLIPQGYQPSYFIYIQLDPQYVDVNVSPTKTEVKFEDESVVFQVVYACVKEVLGRNSFGADIDFEAASAVQMPQLGRNFDEYRQVSAPAVSSGGSYDPFAGTPETPSSSPSRGAQTTSVPSGTFGKYVSGSPNYGFLFEQKEAVQSRAVVVGGKYIMAPAASGMMLINIFRARERVFYDRAMDALQRDEPASQEALFPVRVNVGAAQLPVFEENAAMLRSLGFGISTVGTDTVELGAVPSGYSCEPGKMETLVSDLAIILSDAPGAMLPEMMRQTMAAKMALFGAGHGSEISSAAQAQNLVDALLRSDNPELTATGKRIMKIVSVEEIDKMFQ